MPAQLTYEDFALPQVPMDAPPAPDALLDIPMVDDFGPQITDDELYQSMVDASMQADATTQPPQQAAPSQAAFPNRIESQEQFDALPEVAKQIIRLEAQGISIPDAERSRAIMRAVEEQSQNFTPQYKTIRNPESGKEIEVVMTSPNSLNVVPGKDGRKFKTVIEADTDNVRLMDESTGKSWLAWDATTGEPVRSRGSGSDDRYAGILEAMRQNQPERKGFFSNIFGGNQQAEPTPTPQPTPEPTPSAPPPAQVPTITADAFFQRTGRQLPPGVYQDRNGKQIRIQ